MSDLLFYLFAVAIMALSFVFLKRRNRQAAEALTPERKSDAARLGWAFETDQSTLFEILRWRGTTSDVMWVAESLRSGRSRRTPNRSTTRFTRWWTRRRVEVSGAIVMLPTDRGEESPLSTLNEIDSDSLGGRLVGKVLGSAFEIGFGELGQGIDAKSLKAVDALASRYPNHTVLATNVDAAQAFVFQRLDRLLANAAVSSGTIATDGLSLLITPDGVALSRKQAVADADALVPIVNAGVTLATAISAPR